MFRCSGKCSAGTTKKVMQPDFPETCWNGNTGNTENAGWKIKWFATFRLGIFRKYGLQIEAMQFFYSLQPVQQMWIYFAAGRSSSLSNFIILCVCTRLISTRVVCVSGKHPQFLTNWTWGAMRAEWRAEGWVGFRPWERIRILKPGLTTCFSFYLIRSSSVRLFDFFFLFFVVQ